MLPDFPGLKDKGREALTKLMRDLSRQDGLIALIPRGRDFEGDKMSSGTVDGQVRDSEYTTIQTETSIPIEELIEKGFLAHIEHARKAAADMQRQETQMIFKQLIEVTEKTGNKVDNTGRPLTFETYLDLLNKVWIEFDDNGKPFMPTLVGGPAVSQKFKELMPQWAVDPEFNAKLETIFVNKKKEWDDRESHRKLVD